MFVTLLPSCLHMELARADYFLRQKGRYGKRLYLLSLSGGPTLSHTLRSGPLVSHTFRGDLTLPPNGTQRKEGRLSLILFEILWESHGYVSSPQPALDMLSCSQSPEVLEF